jgi:hypothetical protein
MCSSTFVAAGGALCLLLGVPPPGLMAAAQPDAPPPRPITEISLDHRCFGCEQEQFVTFRPDGTASRLVRGYPRFGTADRRFSGTVPAQVFADLADVMRREGFFELDAEYRDPRVADGGWVTTSVVAAGAGKSVTSANGVGPPNLRRIEEAIEAAATRVAWKQEQPGREGPARPW